MAACLGSRREHIALRCLIVLICDCNVNSRLLSSHTNELARAGCCGSKAAKHKTQQQTRKGRKSPSAHLVLLCELELHLGDRLAGVEMLRTCLAAIHDGLTPV